MDQDKLYHNHNFRKPGLIHASLYTICSALFLITISSFIGHPYFLVSALEQASVSLTAGQKLIITCASGRVSRSIKNNGRFWEVTCYPITTPRPQVTPTTAPTPTPTPQHSPVAHPTEGTSLATSALPVPLCTDHNPTIWHALVQRNSDGTVKCTYGHEHHDDPKVLDNIFGPIGTYTGGQEISYPWQTHGTAGTENHAKHSVYKWNVVSVSTCKPSFAPLGFKNMRGQFHQDAVSGALVRFHSYWLEAQACDPADPSYQGILRVGGHMDYGKLELTGANNSSVHVPLSGDPTTGDDRRLHMGFVNGVVPCCRNGDFTWYGSNRFSRVEGLIKISVRNGLRGEDWGALSPTNPNAIIFSPSLWYGAKFDGNNSWQEPMHLMAITIPSSLDAKDGTTDGKVTLSGFTDRHGNILSSSCAPVSTDCVPFSLENLKVGNYQFRADTNGVTTRDYDVKVNGTSLIQYPN